MIGKDARRALLGSSITFLIAALPASAYADDVFGAPTFYATGAGPAALAIVDLNGDSKKDVVVANKTDDTVSVLLGNGDGTFGVPASYPVGTSPSSIAVARISHDTIPDILVADTGSDDIAELDGNGDGTFQSALYWDVSAPSSIGVYDINGSTGSDFVVTNPSGLTFLFNDPQNPFFYTSTFAAGTDPVDEVLGDFNGDNLVDAVVANRGSDDVSVLLRKTSDINPDFNPAVSYPAGGGPATLTTADVNNDGKNDLVVPDSTAGTVSVLPGKGDGTFGDRIVATTGPGPSAVVPFDFQGDGQPDLLVADGGSDQVSRVDSAGGSLGETLRFPAGAGPTSLALAKLNGDSFYDLVVADGGAGGVSVLLGGKPTLARSPTFLKFTADVGSESAPQAVQFTNTSVGSIKLTHLHIEITQPDGSVTVTDGPPAGYKVADDGCSGQLLAAGASCSMSFVFAPTTAGYSQAMTAMASIPAASGATVSLSGNGIVPPPPPPPPAPALTLQLTGPLAQPALKRGAVRVNALCNVACSLNAHGFVTIKHVKKRFSLTSALTSSPGSTPVTLSLKLPPKTAKAIAKALKKRLKVAAKLTVSAATAAHELEMISRTVRIVG